MKAPALECRDLVKRYGEVTAVDGLDLEVSVGECFGLLGPNGAGKTTTVEVLEGLTPPTSGEVRVLGRTWREGGAALRDRLGVTLQESNLLDKLTVRETLVLFRSFFDSGRSPDEALALVRLTEKARARVASLSGGQRQRLSVACALVGSPEVLFLDEPTTGLDPQSRRSVWAVVERFRADGGTVLLTTHYMEEAERLCDRVAVVDRGKIIALGTPRELIASLGAEHVVSLRVRPSPAPEVFASLASVERVHAEDGRLALTVREPHRAVPAILRRVEQDGYTLDELSTHHATLEDVFVALTGRHLRDD